MPTVAQLKKKCKEQGIRCYSKWRKKELDLPGKCDTLSLNKV